MACFYPSKRSRMRPLVPGFSIFQLLKCTTALCIAATTHQTFAQSFTFTADQLTYIENFDSMGSSLQTPQGWLTNDSGIAVNDGSLLAGGAYNVGAAGSSDRALGLLATPVFSGIFGTSFVNGTGQDLNTLTFAFATEQWRTGSANTVLENFTFQFSLNATSLTDPLAGWVDVSLLNLQEVLTSTASSYAVDGNAPANRLSISAALNTPLPWQPNTRLWVRWKDADDAGNDSLLALDDLTVRVGLNKHLVWNPEAGDVWNLTNSNWLEGPSPRAFVAGDNVTFTDAGLRNGGTVTVASGGVTPFDMSVENTTGTYTFTGGALSGAGTLNKTGAGSLVINNTLNKLLFVRDGQVLLNGDATTSINVLGGTLRTNKDNALANVPAIALSGGGRLELGGHSDVIQELYLTGATFDTGTGVATLKHRSGAPFIFVHPSDTPSRVAGELVNAYSGAALITVSDGAAPEDLIFDARISGATNWSFTGKGTVNLRGDTTALTGSLVLNGVTADVSSGDAIAGLTDMIAQARLRASVPLTGDSALPRSVRFDSSQSFLEGEAIEFSAGARFTGTSLVVNNHTTIAYPADVLSTNFGVDSLVKSGTGTLTFTGKRSALSTLNITDGVVEIANDNLPFAGIQISPGPNSTATLKFIGPTTTAKSLTTSSGSVVVLGDSEKRVDSELILGFSTIKDTAIQEAPGVIGSLRLADMTEIGQGSAANYSGSTIITGGGRLFLRGSITGTTSVVDTASSTFSGDGSLKLGPNGTVVLSGLFNPTSDRTGVTPGALKISGNAVPEHTLTLRPTASLSIALASPAIGGTGNPANAGKNDQVDLTGNLSLESPALILSLQTGFTAALGDLFFIVINDGQEVVDGMFRDLPQGGQISTFYSGKTRDFQISYFGDSATNSFTGGNDIVLRSLAAVQAQGQIPEPSSFGLLALGTLFLSNMQIRPSRSRRADANRVRK